MIGWRTFTFGCLSLATLLAAAFIVKDAALYDHMAWAVVGVMTMVAGKNSIEALAQGGGIVGAFKALTTDAKPGA